MKTLSDRLKEIRANQGLSQALIAKELGCSLPAWQGYESGKNIPGGKVLKRIAELGYNLNWVLTGDGPIRLSEGEKDKLSYDDAHRYIRDRIRNGVSSGLFQRILDVFPDQDEDSIITTEQLRSYVFDDGYIPTNNQLLEIIDRSNLINKKILDPLFDADIKLGSLRNRIDKDLLQCTIEAVEDKKFDISKVDAKEKANLIEFIYSMNLGTEYTTERLKRFLEAILTIVDQIGDLGKLPDWKLSDVVLQIAHHVVKGEKG